MVAERPMIKKLILRIVVFTLSLMASSIVPSAFAAPPVTPQPSGTPLNSSTPPNSPSSMNSMMNSTTAATAAAEKSSTPASSANKASNSASEIAQAAVGKTKIVRALGQNLLGEECSAVDRDDVMPEPSLPVDVNLVCQEKISGSIAYGRFFSPGQLDVNALHAAILSQYKTSRMAKVINTKATCGQAKWLENNGQKAIALMPCKLKSGGWQHIVVLSRQKEELAVADASPSLVSVILRSMGLDDPAIENISTKEYLSQLWGKPIILASEEDLEKFKQLVQQGRNANAQYDFVQAEELFRKALDLQSKFLSENAVEIADTLMDLALNASNVGKAEEAEALFRRAEPIIQKSPFEADRARFLGYQGLAAANRGDFVTALKNAQAATEYWRKLAGDQTSAGLSDLVQGAGVSGSEPFELVLALTFQSNMALRNDDLVSANALASEGLLKLDGIADFPAWRKADLLMVLGEVSIAQGRVSAAETYFGTALAIRKEMFGEGVPTIAVQSSLGRAYQKEGLNTSAIVTYRDVFRMARALPPSNNVMNIEQISPFCSAIVDYAKTLTDDNDKQGLYAEAFDAFQMARSGVVDKTIAKAQARLAADDPIMGALIAEMQDHQRQSDVAKAELALEQSAPDEDRSAIAEARLKKTIDQQKLNADALKKQIAKQFPQYDQLSNPQPIQLLELRKRLGDAEVMVSFVVGRQRSFVQVTRRDGNWVQRVDEGEDSLRDTVKALRRALEIQGGSVNEFDLQRSYQLYKTLFAKIEPQLKGMNHIIVAPAGALASLPFSLLVTEDPSAKSYGKVSWLGQKFAISHVPSLQAFYALRGAPPKRIPPKTLLGFGNPVLEGAKSKNASEALAKVNAECRTDGPMNSATLRALSPLPDTETELKTVAGILGKQHSTLFLQKEATEQNFRAQSLKDYRVLYFATHGLLPGELKCQSEPGLVLTPPLIQANSKDNDGLLEASEIATFKLDADMVVLSACNTAGGGGKFGGEALSGLAESFFFAGARSLVVSHWQVPSAATAKLMSGMFSTLGPELKGGSANALQSAQAKLIAKPETAHPFFWAAFVIVGDGLAASSAELLAQSQVQASPTLAPGAAAVGGSK